MRLTLMDIIRIYRQEPGVVTSAGVTVQGCTSLEVTGGPKRYLRIWDGLNRIEWGWVVSDANIVIWEESE